MTGFLLALACSLAPAREVEVWVEGQKSQILKAGEHPDLSRVLHHAFNTRRLTSDESALPSDWGRVTGDGAALDPYDLAERLLLLSRALSIPVAVADSELGPVVLDPVAGKGWIVVFGDKGPWSERTKGAPLPPALAEDVWSAVLGARHAMALHRVGLKETLSSLKLDPSTPLLARALVMQKGEALPLSELAGICRRYPALPDLRIEGLRRSLVAGDLESAKAFWMEGAGPAHPGLFVQGALLERRLGNPEASLRLARAALRLDPWNTEAQALARGP